MRNEKLEIRKRHFSFLILFCLLAVTVLPAQGTIDNSPKDDRTDARGDAAIAERYVLWAEDAIASGQWSRARAALERAADFADASSDISYLLALARSRVNDNRGEVLLALRQAVRTGIWNRYSEAMARILEAEQLLALRLYGAALESIGTGIASLETARVITGDEDTGFAMLRLAALKGLAESNAANVPEPDLPAESAARFRQAVTEALDLYPRDTRPLRLFFSYARSRRPAEVDVDLLALVLRRLPFLIGSDPELAWMAAPFIADTEEARRLVGAYRSGSYFSQPGISKPNKASIIPALNLGLLNDIDAVEELFSPCSPDSEFVIDKALISGVWDLLRSDEGRDYLAQTLLSFTGVITGDENRDGIPESRAIYRQGILQEFYYDAEQCGIDDTIVLFNTNSPQWAEIAALPAVLPETSPPSPFLSPHFPKALIIWERYPSVQKVVFEGETFLFVPGSFPFVPVNFEELCTSGSYAGLLFPVRNYRNPGISRRLLTASAYAIQRPGTEFEGSTEQVYLRQGIPTRAEETLNGRIVSVTEFENGRPVIQRLDMNLDGTLETIRHF